MSEHKSSEAVSLVTEFDPDVVVALVTVAKLRDCSAHDVIRMAVSAQLESLMPTSSTYCLGQPHGGLSDAQE